MAFESHFALIHGSGMMTSVTSAKENPFFSSSFNSVSLPRSFLIRFVFDRSTSRRGTLIDRTSFFTPLHYYISKESVFLLVIEFEVEVAWIE